MLVIGRLIILQSQEGKTKGEKIAWPPYCSSYAETAQCNADFWNMDIGVLGSRMGTIPFSQAITEQTEYYSWQQQPTRDRNIPVTQSTQSQSQSSWQRFDVNFSTVRISRRERRSLYHSSLLPSQLYTLCLPTSIYFCYQSSAKLLFFEYNQHYGGKKRPCATKPVLKGYTYSIWWEITQSQIFVFVLHNTKHFSF